MKCCRFLRFEFLVYYYVCTYIYTRKEPPRDARKHLWKALNVMEFEATVPPEIRSHNVLALVETLCMVVYVGVKWSMWFLVVCYNPRVSERDPRRSKLSNCKLNHLLAHP